MSINRETARKRAALARVGAVALLVAAGVRAAIPMSAPRPEEPAGAAPAPPSPTDAVAMNTGDQSGFDLLGMTSTLDAIGVARAPAPLASIDKPTEDPGKGSGPTPPPPPTDNSWKYIGSVVGPRSTHAMVSIGGKQRLIGPDTELDGVRLVRVAPDQIVVSENGVDRTIHIAPRSTAWPNAQTKAVPTAPPAPAPGQRPGMITPQAPPQQPPQMNGVTPDEQERIDREKMLLEEMERARQKQPPAPGGAPAGSVPGAPIRPAPVPTDASPAGPPPKGAFIGKGLGGAGSRH